MDKFLIDMAQTGYAWLWNRFGVYRGHIMYACFVVAEPIVIAYSGIWNFLTFGLCFATLCGFRWNYLQSRERYQAINAEALRHRKDSFLVLARLFLIAVFGIAIFIGASWWGYFYWTAIFLFSYLDCVLVNKREPPECKQLQTRGA